jgi:hypothetical protein
MEKKADFLNDQALVSKLRMYYNALPEGCMDTLVDMAKAQLTENLPKDDQETAKRPENTPSIPIASFGRDDLKDCKCFKK